MTHFVKLCHALLPTGKVLVCTYGAGYPNYCPLYCTLNEDFHHVLQCPHTLQVKWHTKLLQTLQERHYSSLKTSPIFVEILVGSLTLWLLALPFDKTEFPAEYSVLLHEQRTIGWSHIWMSKQWVHF
jgi:hypothetical protein